MATQYYDSCLFGTLREPERYCVYGTVHFDGSCAPNPGPDSKCGIVLEVDDEYIRKTYNLGYGTNNTAEWHGVILAMKLALHYGVTHLTLKGDAMIVIRDIRNRKIGSSKHGNHLTPLKIEAMELAKQFDSLEAIWVPRYQNADADAMSTAMRGQRVVTSYHVPMTPRHKKKHKPKKGGFDFAKAARLKYGSRR